LTAKGRSLALFEFAGSWITTGRDSALSTMRAWISVSTTSPFSRMTGNSFGVSQLGRVPA
jgi:hypothetical protein